MDGTAKTEDPGEEHEAIANQRTLRDTFRLWIDPEIERRKAAATLPEDFQLRIAQVILNVDAPTVVRINEEVRAAILVSKMGGSAPKQKGDRSSGTRLKTYRRSSLRNSIRTLRM